MEKKAPDCVGIRNKRHQEGDTVTYRTDIPKRLLDMSVLTLKSTAWVFSSRDGHWSVYLIFQKPWRYCTTITAATQKIF